MRITSSTNGNINGTILVVGLKEYPEIDHKDKSTAEQLRILRDETKTISFEERLACDMAKLKAAKEAKEKAAADTDTDTDLETVLSDIEAVNYKEVLNVGKTAKPTRKSERKKFDSGSEGKLS